MSTAAQSLPALGQHVRFTTKATEYSSVKTFTGTYDVFTLAADGRPRFRAYAPDGSTLRNGHRALSMTSYAAADITGWEPIEAAAVDPADWPTQGYISAVDRVIAQIVDFTEKDQIPAPLQAKTAMASGKVQGCRTVFARQPNTETLAKLMEAGQAAWLAMIPIDPHRKQWDEAYSAWQSAWAIYVRTKPSKPCPDCGKQAPMDNYLNTAQAEVLAYYKCLNCSERWVSRNGGELEAAA